MAKRHNRRTFFSTQFITSCISTTLVLILLGTITMFVLMAQNLSTYVRENINVSVLLSDDLVEDDVKGLQAEFAKQPYVKSIQYISKEQALKEQTEAMGTDPTEFIDVNPFTASFEIKMNSAFANNDSLTNIVRRIKSNDKIIDVLYQKELMQSVNDNISKLSLILLIIAALFTYISFELINNTVRLTIFARRFIINTMKLVGASWNFIRRPFLKQALFLGIVSAILADLFIYFGVQWLQKFDPEINAVIDNKLLIIVGVTVLAFGLLITFLCTYASLSKYLKMSSNDLYHV
ncbi:MAG: permease-like cell division protein FtsX [Bacteroidaceae bacterium]|nr:permease-like cell division protein FtsX [Bacteroidaceae bacterium]